MEMPPTTPIWGLKVFCRLRAAGDVDGDAKAAFIKVRPAPPRSPGQHPHAVPVDAGEAAHGQHGPQKDRPDQGRRAGGQSPVQQPRKQQKGKDVPQTRRWR